MPEGVDDPGEAPRDAPMVFVSDASAEAERLTQALRGRGYQVADVPLALLLGRMAIQMPALVVCDADADQAMVTLEKLRDDPRTRPVPTVLLGERDGPLERVGPGLIAAAFVRPVNVRELVGTVARLIGRPMVEPSPPSLPPSTRGKLVTSSRPPGRAAPASIAPSRERPIRPEAASKAAAAPLPPDLAGDGGVRESGDAPVVELSRAMQELLAAAERRLVASPPQPPPSQEGPGPEGEEEGPLSPETLAALDDPLDEEDMGEEGSSPGPGADGTSAWRLGAPNQTRAGRTGAITFAGEGTQAPDGEQAVPPARSGHTGIGGPAVEMPAATEPPPPEDDAARARQQASTPKPPRPATPASEAPGAAAEVSADDRRQYSTTPPRNLSVPPRGSAEGQPEARPEPRELTSTTPPLNRRDGADRRTPADRESEHPMPSRARGERAREGTADALEVGAVAGPPVPRDERPSEPPALTRRARPSELPAPSAREAPDDAPPLDPSRRADKAREGSGASAKYEIEVPPVLRPGDTVLFLARAIRARFTGALAIEVDEGIRRIVLREGDFVTVASGVHGESLVSFLATRGDLPADVARQAHKLPAFGRRAGAALIAQGHLAQDQLWTALRAHAEWLVGRACRVTRGAGGLEDSLIERLKDEPAVFGGATGAEVLVDIVRRVVPPDEAMERLGGPFVVVEPGPAHPLLGECALPQADVERVQGAAGRTVADLVALAEDPSFVSVLYALSALGVIATGGSRARADVPARRQVVHDAIDDEARRTRILSRKALVDEGDYFAVLGVPRDATGYDIRRAYSSLRKEFEPSNVLTPATVDLGDAVTEIVDVLEEAYEVLGDQRRRDRYLRAIEAVP